MSAKFQIETIVPSDENAVRTFLAGAIERPGAEAGMPPGWLDWLAQGAAAGGVPDVPLGWKLVVEGEVGGVHMVVPFREAAVAGGEAVSLQSSGFYVDPRWHGPASGALFLALMKYRTRFHCSVSTANEKAARVWKAFKAEEQQESGDEWCTLRFGPALLEEALLRRVPWLKKLFPRKAPAVRASLPLRLDELRKNLGLAVKAAGLEAVPRSAALLFSAGGALPTPALLEWMLSSPDRRHSLLFLEIDGQPCAAFFTAGPRGHRGQAPALSISAVWGPAWEAVPAVVMAALLRAARPLFPFVTLGFGPAPESIRPLLRRRALDAPRRWRVYSGGQPPILPGWNGLNSL